MEESLEKLQYLHAALSEILRIGSPLLVRHPVGWVQRGQGDLVVYIAMGRMESFWGDDAQVFRPERLIDEEGMYRHESPFKFTAFQDLIPFTFSW
ncbi:hypothetical protein HPP92_008084 [Vanilla planifolia]|uniref:Cytochrome P450 n=1 Tax=Vanilla planifolia TaxID=51239 RepID=A0A835RN92_VANPL|nr:hypothetical protein HPP92_008084 [Vanilla planifolia]